MGKRRKSRELAMQALYQIDVGNQSLNDVIDFNWNETRVDDEIKDFAKKLVQGTFDKITEIDSHIEKYAKDWNLNRINPIERNILRYSIYSIIYQKEIPAAVIINEAVDIAKKFCEDDSYKFINGILDEISRQSR